MPKAKARVTITVTEEFCKGCGLCIAVCPQHSMQFADRMNSRGIRPAHLADPEHCTGCAQCATMCPDACLRITRSK